VCSLGFICATKAGAVPAGGFCAAISSLWPERSHLGRDRLCRLSRPCLPWDLARPLRRDRPFRLFRPEVPSPAGPGSPFGPSKHSARVSAATSEATKVKNRILLPLYWRTIPNQTGASSYNGGPIALRALGKAGKTRPCGFWRGWPAASNIAELAHGSGTGASDVEMGECFGAVGGQQTSRWRRETAGANGCKVG
jgi:hypothetical protein